VTLILATVLMVLSWFINPVQVGGDGIFWVSGLLIFAVTIVWVIDSLRIRKIAQKIAKSTGRQIVKILARIFLVIILVPMALLALFILWTVVTNPIFGDLDHDKFMTLDTQMQKVYREIVSASNGADEWKYKTSCSDVNQNWLGPPDYLCGVTIITKKTISSVTELNDHQAKYLPVVDASDELTALSNSVKSAGDFGKDFNVSLAYKDYVEKKTGIGCNFEIALHQTDSGAKRDDLGSPIDGGEENFSISLTCEESARNYWYGLTR